MDLVAVYNGHALSAWVPRDGMTRSRLRPHRPDIDAATNETSFHPPSC